MLLMTGVLHEGRSKHAHNYAINTISYVPLTLMSHLGDFRLLSSIQCVRAASLGEIFESMPILIN